MFLQSFNSVFLQSLLSQDLGWGKVMIIRILYSIHTFGYYFSNPIDCILLRWWAIPQIEKFCISYRLSLPGIFNVFICLFLHHSQGSHYFLYINSIYFNFSSHVCVLFYHTLWFICYYLLALTFQLEGFFFFNSP